MNTPSGLRFSAVKQTRREMGYTACEHGGRVSEQESLAWYQYPAPHGRHYAASELEDEAIVEALFDYCQILLAVISARGWQKLIDHYGVPGLLAINHRSGWFDASEPGTAMEALRYHCLLSGYEPETRTFGTYDEGTGRFTSQGTSESRQIAWGESWTPGSPG